MYSMDFFFFFFSQRQSLKLNKTQMNKGICREIGTIGLHTHTTGSNETEELLLKRGAVSVVWKFFGFKKSDVEQTTIFCKCCWAKVVAAGGSTSNLLHHLIHKHVLEYQEFMKLRSASSMSAGKVGTAGEKTSQMSLKDAFARGTAYDKKSKRWNDITNTITIHIAKDMVPHSSVEKEGFREMIKILDPRYVLPSRKYFSQTAIPNLYQKHRAKLEADVVTVPTSQQWLICGLVTAWTKPDCSFCKWGLGVA